MVTKEFPERMPVYEKTPVLPLGFLFCKSRLNLEVHAAMPSSPGGMSNHSYLAVECVRCEKLTPLAGLPALEEGNWQLEGGIACYRAAQIPLLWIQA